MKRLLAVLGVLVVVAGLAAAATAWVAWDRWTAPVVTVADSHLVTDSATRILIPRGAGVRRIAALLRAEGLLRDDLDEAIFPVAIRLTAEAGPLRAGEYDIPAGASPAAIADQLRAGTGLVQHVVTVAEGLTTPVILDMLRAVPELEGDITLTPPTGALLPETYHFTRGDSRDAVVRRMVAAMDRTVGELWDSRAEGLPLSSPEEAVILASIVERETGMSDERALVAGVFINRLRRGMRLQSDPTVIYGMSPDTGTLDRPLLRADLTLDHAWNTYVIAGLPPSPIANPGRASLAAVLNPAQTEYLYFVADGTGGHAFARTLADHNRNVAAWRRVQRDQRTGQQ